MIQVDHFNLGFVSKNSILTILKATQASENLGWIIYLGAF